MSLSATPVPPPSSFDLAEWITEDWQLEVARTSYRYRKQARKSACNRFMIMLLFTIAAFLCIVLWASAGESHATGAVNCPTHRNFAADGQWSTLGLFAFVIVVICLLSTPLVVFCAWREQPVPRHPVPMGVTQNSKVPDNSTPSFVNARFASSQLSTVRGANTVRDLLDSVFERSAARVAVQWRTVQAVVPESRTVGTAQGTSRTQLVEKWVLHNQAEQALFHEVRFATLSVGGGMVALLEDLDRQQLMGMSSLPMGIARDSKPHIAMLSEGRPELTLATLACLYHGLTSVQVPLSNHTTVQRCLETTQCSVLVCEAFNLEQVVEVSGEGDDGGRKCPSLRVVVLLQDRNDPDWQPLPPSGVASIGQLTQSQEEAARTLTERGMSIMTWAALHALGETVSPLLQVPLEPQKAFFAPQVDAVLPMANATSDSMTGISNTLPVSPPTPLHNDGRMTPSSDAESVVDPALLPSSDVSASMHMGGVPPPPAAYLSLDMVSADMVQSDSPAFIMFTGSATGNARAVTLSHANVLAAVASMCATLPGLDENDVYLSFNPPSMPLEWNLQLALFCSGGCVAFAHHNSLMQNSKRIPAATRLLDGEAVRGDAAVLRPSLLFATPAQIDRFAHAWRIQVDSYEPIFRQLVQWGETTQRAAAARGRSAPAWDLLFAPLRREMLGTRLRMCVASGGVLLPHTHQFMRGVCGCAVLQVYGCAESCGVGGVSWPLVAKADTAGAAAPCGKYKLVDMPESQVKVAGKSFPVGEVCLAGGNLGSRYWASAAPRTNVEWLRTGDVGQILGDGSLHILGRKAEVMRLTTGRLVSLARIEAAARSCPWVASVAAYADPARAFAVVLVAPDLLALSESAELLACDSSITLPRGRGGQLQLSVHILVHSRVVHDFILGQIQAACRAAGMTQHQQPHGIALVPQPWKSDSGLVSHTLTPVRHHIAERYAAAIARAYKKSAGNAALAEEAQSSIALEGLAGGATSLSL